MPDGIDLKGMRIGINGEEAPVGQAFAHLDTTISSALYSSETGQPLATLGTTALGTVVPLEKGPGSDEFFLTFDALGANPFSRPPSVLSDTPVM